MNTAAAYILDDIAPLPSATWLRLVTGGGYADNDECYEGRATEQTYPHPNPDGTTSHSTKPASGQVAGYLPAGEGANVALLADQTLEDANGNRTMLTDPDNNVTRYTYDALNRVNTVTNTGGTTTYAYDRSSLKTRVGYPNGTTAANTHDRARRILTHVNRQGSAPVSSYQLKGPGSNNF